MTYPTKPSIQTSYTAVEQALGDGTLPGQELDVDFANLKFAVDALNDFVRGITRSDGRLANASVSRDTLGPDILIGFGAPTTWGPGENYQPPETVFFSDGFYLCVVPHTSGVDFATDLAANRWSLLVDFAAVLSGSLAAEAGAVAALAEFRTRYIGAAASDPATDPAGGALIDGALYWNTAARRLKVYDAGTTAWLFTTPTSAEQTAINTVAGISANVTTVAGISGSVTTVAGNTTNINTVASNNANVTTVAGISGSITTVAGNTTNINAVAGNSTNINTVSGISGSVTTVAGVSADVTAVAGNSTNINAVAGNATNINSVAGNSSNINAVAGNSTNINTVAGISANVTTVAGVASSIPTVAANVTDITNFSDVYLGPAASNPALRNDGSALQVGDLYFNTVAAEMRVYDGAAWKAAGSAVNGTTRRQTFTATAGQTVFAVTGGYDPNFADVYLNGVKLVNGVDVAVTSGTNVVLTVGAGAGDVVDVVAYGAFVLADVPPNARAINTGTGLTGGGDLSADRTLALTGQALALHNLATSGMVARTGAGTVAARTITAGTGIGATNGDGVSGNPTIALTGQALALHNLATSGMVARTGAGTVAARTITGTANQITVTNGDGVSGNPVVALTAEVYRRANILGTVSQTGGVPTGAIIERGSNANGSFVKYADGTLICNVRIAITPVANTPTTGTATLPAAFVAGYDGDSATTSGYTAVATSHASVAALTRGALVEAASTATAVSINILRSNTTVTNNSVMCIGRWF